MRLNDSALFFDGIRDSHAVPLASDDHVDWRLFSLLSFPASLTAHLLETATLVDSAVVNMDRLRQ